jgi:hypothetical protein
MGAEVGLSAFRECKDEDCPFTRPEDDYRTVSTSFAGVSSRNPLLDQPAAEIRADQSALCPYHSFAKSHIVDTFLAGEFLEPCILEEPQGSHSEPSWIYNTKCNISMPRKLS